MTADATDWSPLPPCHPPETWLHYEIDNDTNSLDRVFVDDGWPPPDPPPVPEERPQRDPDTFLATVTGLLPEICPEYAHQHGHEYGWDPELFLNRVLEEESNGTRYPRRAKKRKRDDEDDDADTKESKLQKLRNKYDGQISQHVKDHHYNRVS